MIIFFFIQNFRYVPTIHETRCSSLMNNMIVQSLASAGTGILVGVVFAMLRLPIPAPPAIPAVFGIFGITLGYLLWQYFMGK